MNGKPTPNVVKLIARAVRQETVKLNRCLRLAELQPKLAAKMLDEANMHAENINGIVSNDAGNLQPLYTEESKSING